jgi:hypothetical protein
MKVNMAGATMLLGLTPSIIARSPLPEMYLAAAAPSVYPFRAVNYKEAIENLHNQNRRPQRFTRLYQYLVMICEFVVIAWAMTNNATKSPAR